MSDESPVRTRVVFDGRAYAVEQEGRKVRANMDLVQLVSFLLMPMIGRRSVKSGRINRAIVVNAVNRIIDKADNAEMHYRDHIHQGFASQPVLPVLAEQAKVGSEDFKLQQ